MQFDCIQIIDWETDCSFTTQHNMSPKRFPASKQLPNTERQHVTKWPQRLCHPQAIRTSCKFPLKLLYEIEMY